LVTSSRYSQTHLNSREQFPSLVDDYIDHTTMNLNVDKMDTFFLPLDVVVIRDIPLITRRQEDF
jgi:hypothetical protein